MLKVKSRCNFCSSSNYNQIYEVVDPKTEQFFSIVKCQNCELLCTLPILPKAELLKYYSGYRKNSGKRFLEPIEDFISFWHMKRAKQVRKLVKKGNILDIGCGRGLELAMLKKDGWHTYATELSRDLKKSLLEKGIKPFFGEVWKLKGKKEFFDVITLWHSLEHISDPNKVIITCKKLLRKNGYLIIACPNFDSLERKLFDIFWFHLDVPRHLYHFSQKILRAQLEKNRFKIITEKYSAPEYDFFSLWQGSINKIYSNYPNLIYRILQKDHNVQIVEKMIALSQFPLLLLIIALSIFVVPFFWITKQSGTIEITAQKTS